MIKPKSFPVITVAVGSLIALASLSAGYASNSIASTSNVSIAVPSACRQSYKAYAVSKSFLRACGDSIVPLRRVKELPGHGKAYIYDAGGFRAVTRIPPRGFEPKRASAGKLAQYGYPPRPSGGQALRSWTTMVQGTHFITPPKYLVTIPRHVNTHSAIWAGNVSYQCSGCNTYQDVYANWLEPHTGTVSCNSTGRSVWAGLGGWNTQTLAQAGTAVGEGSAGAGDHQAWYELINPTTDRFVPVSGLYATVGGEFTAEVDRVSGGYYIFLKNDYTGDSNGGTTVTFQSYDGSHAEAIVEDPFGGVANGEYLRKFDQFEIEDAEASRDGTHYHGLAWFDHLDVVMYYNQEMAHPGSAFNSGDSWYDNFDHCS